MNKDLKITVFLGGISSEREISLKTGNAIANALISEGYNVSLLDPNPEKGWSLPQGTDVVFLALHGEYGEDGTVQSELDKLGIPYTGCGAEASRIGFDKLLTREYAVAQGVLMPPAIILDKVSDVLPEGWNFPVVLKPLRQGSSVGVQFVDRESDFKTALEKVFTFGEKVLMEKRIFGRELAVGIVDGEVLPIVEICPHSGVYDYKSKYTSGQTNYICPAKLDVQIVKKAGEMALKTFHAIGGKDYSRVDIIADKDGNCWVLEINTLPGMTATSLLPKAAAAKGITFVTLCEKMLEMALRKI